MCRNTIVMGFGRYPGSIESNAAIKEMLTKKPFLVCKGFKILRNFNHTFLRYLLIILTLCFFRSFAQQTAPDLRCIRVLGGGSVQVTWRPSLDPGNTFSSYDIYYSPTPNGPFTLAGSQSPISNTSYTHTGSVTNLQSCYYFVRAVFSGPVVKESDTLRSIFLNLINVSGGPDVKLVYNNVTTPRLPTYSGPNIIYKEYPIGTWNTLATINELTYSDIISVCQASMNYQVTMQDNSGCLSVSNIQGGTFNDFSQPAELTIDSISVLPNGNVILAWQVSKDADVTKYAIYQAVNTLTLGIDTVQGINSTSFTYTGTGSNILPVGLTVSALDSCANPGTFALMPRTILVGVYYDSCKFESMLYWNTYTYMPKGVSEYRVYYSVNGGPFNQVGTTTETSFIHGGVNPGQSICYYIRAFNKGKTISSTSNRICFSSYQAKAPGYIYMRTATVLNKNTVTLRLFLDTSKSCKGIEIYRSNDGLSYRKTGFVSTDITTPDYTFEDTAQSSTRSYFYRAAIIDNCGNQRTQSNVSRTMYLNVEEDKEFIFTKRLSWNFYSGFAGGVSGYNIYRLINDEPPKEAIASLGLFSNSYTDNLEDDAPKGAKIEYKVEAVEGIGNPFGFGENSFSNTRPVYMEGQVFVPDAFAPAGVNKTWLPVTHFIDKTDYHVRVFNRWGNLLFETHSDTQSWNGDDAPSGIYVYLITYKNARGEYQEVKGTFMLFR